MDTIPSTANHSEVKSLLSRLGWTHQRAAEHLGVGRVTVSRWATGSRDPGEQVLRHLRLLCLLQSAHPDTFEVAVRGDVVMGGFDTMDA